MWWDAGWPGRAAAHGAAAAGDRVGPAMSAAVTITDAADGRLADFRDLKRADTRPDRPGGRGLVIAEGTVVVRRMIESRYRIRALLGVARRYAELQADLVAVSAPFYVTDADTMAAAIGFHLNRGVLATADRIALPSTRDLLAAARRVAVLEGVGDHENIGAIFRNAAALGIDAVLLSGGCADPLYRRSVRVSMGNVLRMPFSTLPLLGYGGADLLRSAGFVVAALTPAEQAAFLDPHMPMPERVAVVLGSEGAGLSDAALRAADVLLRIPMVVGVDSLNVASAAAVAFAVLGRAARGG